MNLCRFPASAGSWRIEHVEDVTRQLLALERGLGETPEVSPKITDGQWAELIVSLARSEVLHFPDWPSAGDWELEAYSWTPMQTAAVSYRCAQARKALAHVSSLDPSQSVLLPAENVRRFDVLLGEGRLPIARVQQLEFGSPRNR